MNITLAGMPGCGKTTVSRILAELTGRKQVDTDGEIVKEHGGISEIFAKRGEEYFRGLESEVCERFSRLDGLVISVGGGCVLNGRNVDALKKNGVIVYLKTSPAELAKRLADDNTRPLLAGDVNGKLEELYAARRGKYESAADYIVETDGLSPSEVANKITEFVI